ncbi:MAG TPA: protease, partial [Bacteroidales bacterium]|nr:protease [Bacteroidales bacterium]
MKKLILLLFLISSVIVFSQNESRLLRFPNIHGNQIVFTYAGDLYTVAKSGGIARKLTSDKGFEMFAKISPDGKYIAFTGQFDSNTEVYVMPAKGGAAKRLTYTATLKRDDVADRMGPNNMVVAWTPDSKNIIYRSRKQSFNSFVGQLFSVPISGGISKELPLSTGGFCSFSPDGKKLAFNRVMREFRTWKYYKGGMADDIRIFDFEQKKVTKITNNPAQDIFPMWWENTIYFMSDRDRTMNLFAYNLTTKTIDKVTNFTEYDCKFPSIGDGQIVFENAGYIYIFDIATQKTNKVTIQINDDFEANHPQIKNAYKHITNISPSPAANRIAFAARGDIFNVPCQEGITYNLTKTSDAHERNVKWSPDGKYIAYLSDESGEFEIWMVKSDYTSKPVQLTKNADTYYFNIKWSPDSKKIMFNDKKMRLQYIDIETKKTTLVVQNKLWEITQFNWSPDSKWIAYAQTEENHFNAIYLYNLNTKQSTAVTEDWFNSNAPVFSDDGKYLFFVSKRDFNPIYSSTEWNHAYIDMNKIYFLTLSKKTKSPLSPTNDTITIETVTTKSKKTKSENNKTKTVADIKIDFDGISQRIAALPITASNYWNINIIDNKVYYNERHYKGKTKLKMYDLKKKTETELGENMFYSLSSNGKKFIIHKSNQYYVVNTPKTKINLSDTKPVNIKNMRVSVDLHKEWKQIFDEGWRQMRDFFYVKNMHGINWKAMHDKYAILLPYVNHRKDLTYIMGEMIGELTIGHAYVGGGDTPEHDKIYTGLLRAKLSR